VASGINTLVDCLGCAVFIHSRHRRRASIKSERAQSAYDGHSLSFFVTSLTGDLAVAGAAINELIDGIPRADNPGMGGDMQAPLRFSRPWVSTSRRTCKCSGTSESSALSSASTRYPAWQTSSEKKPVGEEKIFR